MYDKIKILLNHPTYRYIIIGSIGFILILCFGYIFYQPNGADYQRARESVERIEKQQRESLELNRSVQRSIDRSADYSREAATELNEAKNTIDKLTTELDKAKADLVKQEVTLSEMSSSLIELKGQIENDKKTIKRLRMQRNLSQILGAGATIGVVIHR